jgi:hypothetical protein
MGVDQRVLTGFWFLSGRLVTEPPVGERRWQLKRVSTSRARSRPGRLVRVPVALMGCRAAEH